MWVSGIDARRVFLRGPAKTKALKNGNINEYPSKILVCVYFAILCFLTFLMLEDYGYKKSSYPDLPVNIM